MKNTTKHLAPRRSWRTRSASIILGLCSYIFFVAALDNFVSILTTQDKIRQYESRAKEGEQNGFTRTQTLDGLNRGSLGRTAQK